MPDALHEYSAETTAGLRVGQLLKAIIERLRRAGRSESRLKAEGLVSHVLGCPRLELCLRSRDFCTPAQGARMEALAARVEGGEPLQYVLGQVDFMGLRLGVDRRALIPRPETELLVERALACEDIWQVSQPVVVDVGTGSGCVALALALAHPQARIRAVDVSPEALSLACENGKAHFPDNERICFVEGHLLEGVSPGSVDLVISNPPYIATPELHALSGEIKDFEPRLALDGGPDGLTVIRELVKQAARVLRRGGWLIMEIGETQGGRLKQLLRQENYTEVFVEPDLAGRDRVAGGRVR